MNAPKIDITFIEKAKTIIERGERGIVGLILKEQIDERLDETSTNDKSFIVQFESDIPEWITDFNKEQIKLTLIGNVTAPKMVICYVINDVSEYNDALAYIKKSKATILAVPTVLTDGMIDTVVSFIKSTREEEHKKIIVVLPFSKTEDYEGIVGCDFEAISNDRVYSNEEYCSRIAGLIAGTPLNQSITYATLSDLTDCNRLKEREMDTAVDEGKLILMNDGEKVKVVRGVNTLQSTTKTKGESFKKIKIVSIMDLIYDDILISMRDDYIGKYNNDYDDKCVLMTAINNYFLSLIGDGLITEGKVEIDINAMREYLKKKGEDVLEMSEKDIKEANTGSIVYFRGTVKIPDAIEDIVFPIYI